MLGPCMSPHSQMEPVLVFGSSQPLTCLCEMQGATAVSRTGQDSGMGLPLLGRLLGHKQPVTTQKYAHLDAAPLAQGGQLDRRGDEGRARKRCLAIGLHLSGAELAGRLPGHAERLLGERPRERNSLVIQKSLFQFPGMAFWTSQGETVVFRTAEDSGCLRSR
jgi:hypothetical protein